MFPQQFSSLQFFQKKKDIYLYKACDPDHKYILKSIITKDASVKQAFYDEYYSLHPLKHPGIPIYHGICDDLVLPHSTQPALTMCMEDCSPKKGLTFLLSLPELIAVLLQVGDVLSFLLEHGILYTDLHPSNLLIDTSKPAKPGMDKNILSYHTTLVDYTYCYYYLRNARPTYSLRFSYDLDSSLRGQQLIIQEMTFLFHELIEQNSLTDLPFSVCLLLETGMHPSEDLSLHDYLSLLKKCII